MQCDEMHCAALYYHVECPVAADRLLWGATFRREVDPFSGGESTDRFPAAAEVRAALALSGTLTLQITSTRGIELTWITSKMNPRFHVT
jgi:hypothetical protein